MTNISSNNAVTEEEREKAFSKLLSNRYYTDQYNKNSKKSVEAYEEFLAFRTLLLSSRPFWGITSLELVYVDTDLVPGMSQHCQYAAVDPFHIYINPTGWMSLTEQERETAIAHEVMHIIEGHTPIKVIDKDGKYYWLDRRADRDPEKWGHAIDHVDNLTIYEAGFAKFTSFIPYADPKYTNWTSEEVYDDIEEDGSNGEQDFDLHIQFVLKEGNVPSAGDVTVDDYVKKIAAWDTAILRGYQEQKAHDQDNGITGGSIPAGVLRAVSKLYKPRVDLWDNLRAFLEEVAIQDYSYMEPDTRFFSDGLTLPGFLSYDDEYLEGWVALDLSGSVDDARMERFVAEMFGVMERAEYFKIGGCSFDAEVQEDTVRYFEQDNREEFRDWIKELRGCGGTVFSAVQDYLKKQEIRPRFMVFFSDGEPNADDWGDPEFCPTIFVLQPHGSNQIKAPYGTTICLPPIAKE